MWTRFIRAWRDKKYRVLEWLPWRANARAEHYFHCWITEAIANTAWSAQCRDLQERYDALAFLWEAEAEARRIAEGQLRAALLQGESQRATIEQLRAQIAYEMTVKRASQ